MKVSFVQFAPTLGEPEATRERVGMMADDFANSDLVVLPELANSGYAFESPQQAQRLAEEPHSSPFVDMLMGFCRKNNQHIVTGLCERAGDRLYNSAVVVSAKGVLSTYRKLHLFMNEKDVFEPGDLGLPICTVGDCRVGLLICYDWRFPEVWRILSLKGVDLICHPSNLVTPGLSQRVTPVYALVNRLFIVTANRTGTEGPLTFTGLSQTVDPEGEVLAKATALEEVVRTVSVDVRLARDKQANARNHLLEDRRPDCYTALTEP
jgi:predicted amidohydrolase